MRRIVLLAPLLFAFSCTAASEESSGGAGGAAPCEPGEEVPCTCGELSGVEVCGDDGTFASCLCTDDGPPCPSGATLAAFAPLQGCHALALQTPVAPDNPLVLLAEVRIAEDDANCPTLQLTLHPVAANPLPSTSCSEDGLSPGDPVGEPMVLAPSVLGVDGSIAPIAVPLRVGGCGNAISGSDLEGQLSLSGFVEEATRLCGTSDGDLSRPFPLQVDGSTWATLRLTGTVDDGCAAARDAWRASPPVVELVCAEPPPAG